MKLLHMCVQTFGQRSFRSLYLDYTIKQIHFCVFKIDLIEMPQTRAREVITLVNGARTNRFGGGGGGANEEEECQFICSLVRAHTN